MSALCRTQLGPGQAPEALGSRRILSGYLIRILLATAGATLGRWTTRTPS
jgi:hypothetical protein